ncbi:2-octaprenyl-6-methoxyphenyl hydroxylase [Photobacterium iliopiscarium]|uniref:2-octaprenyl-6-methoxyphenyl hydroxylase n=1 Tax=Photobacterium iliopiscarium TaxID=56192 RepID=UPI001E410852|nr:2-octaprenyl-6-methoxyphenyl hydroxylase [Photobacterium iliopiscarium]MCD9487799.1 2-octaprenyl-6-methoxyphenyl hydroxylase [Photobacterium iliopiscarium]MCF2244452.1 2-octaprenyl-6-methoxyphenyl hydroxylase [Photobacterium iliopiscarium]
MKQYDVVIAGGAMVGACLAIALDELTQHQLHIAVVEAVAADQHGHPGYDARSIALSHGSSRLLDTIQLWPTLANVATAIKHIHVSDRGHAGMVELSAQQLAVDALGYVIELAEAGKIFHHQLATRSNIDLFCPAKVEHIERTQAEALVRLNTGKRLRTKLVVAADGATSHCCELLHIGRDEYDFEQVAVIANITTAEPHQGQAFERFTEHGPVALLPMAQGRSSLVWCIEPQQQARIMALSDAQFLTELQAVFGWRLGALMVVGERHCYPLILRQSQRLVSHRTAVIGNAAQTLHPIAGQGFNLGLRDAMTLAEEIAAGVKRGADIGLPAVLGRYRERRLPDRQATIAMTTSLVSLFANDNPALAVGRNLGLMTMSLSNTLQAPLLRRAMGQVKR